jgi:competence protein ComEC
MCAAAPLGWLVIPMAAGIACTRYMGWSAIAIPCLVLPLMWNQSFRTRIATLIAAFLAGILLFKNAYLPQESLFSGLPPRETCCQLRIDELFNARKPERVAGIGTILSTDIPHDIVSTRQAAFYLDTSNVHNSRVELGEVILCRAVLTYLPFLNEPDDYQLYLLGRDIYLTLNNGSILEQLQPPPVLERVRSKLFQQCQAVLTTGCVSEQDMGNVLASMLLGNRSLLTDERIDTYRRTGTYHLFAVSGLHVGSVALCLHLLTGFFRFPAVWRLVPILCLMWTYVWITGSSPSAVRAGIMVSTLILSRHLLRQNHLFPALMLSACIVLVIDPYQLFHLGFQLSYGVVTSITLIGLPLAQEVRKWMNQQVAMIFPMPKWKRRLHVILMSTTDLILVSTSASLASMPLIIRHFELFTPGGIPMGVALNALVTVTVITGCTSLLLSIIPLPVAGWIAMATWPLLWCLEGLLTICLMVPGAVSSRYWTWPPTGILLLLAGLASAWIIQLFRQQGMIRNAAFLLLPPIILISGLTLSEVGT